MDKFLQSLNNDLVPRFYRLAIVNILSNIMVPLAGLVDLAFLGHLSNIRYLAGISLSAIIFSYLYRLLSFLRMGTTGVTAQAVGRGDREEMLLIGMRNFLVALIIGSTILIMQYPLREIGFALLSATKEVEAVGIDYFNARIWGVPAVLINLVLIGWLLGREMTGKVFIMSLVGNGINIVLDYFFIIRFGWYSAGAGLASALSQYVALFLGLILVIGEIQWEEIQKAVSKLLDLTALKKSLILNVNILLRTTAIMSVFFLFTQISAILGTVFLAVNSILVQVIFFTIFFYEGIGFATESLSGNFQGQESKENLISLVVISVVTSLLTGLTIALGCILFPQTIFRLLTNHTEVIDLIKTYDPWLLIILLSSAIAFLLDGYFLGLAESNTVRNVAVTTTLIVFIPLALAAWYLHNNQTLWLALSLFIASRALLLVIQLPRTFTVFNNSSQP